MTLLVRLNVTYCPMLTRSVVSENSFLDFLQRHEAAADRSLAEQADISKLSKAELEQKQEYLTKTYAALEGSIDFNAKPTSTSPTPYCLFCTM